jgi:hypothetical protein
MFHMASRNFKLKLAARNGAPIAADEYQEYAREWNEAL